MSGPVGWASAGTVRRPDPLRGLADEPVHDRLQLPGLVEGRELPIGARAVQISDGTTSNYFLTTFGRATRETVCSCEVKMEPNLSQALHLLNGDTVNAKITSGTLIKRRLDEGKVPQDILEELYIRCLCRRPTEAERTNLNAVLLEEKNHQQVLEDVFWALMNSREFLFNH